MYVAYSSLAAAMILVGLNIPVGKMLLADFPVFTFTFIRGLMGIAVLFPLIMIREGGRVPRPEGKGIKAVILQAFLGVFLFNLFILWGLERTSSINAGIITSTIPAAVALLGFLFFRERLSVRAVGIILLAVAGVMMVNLGGGGSTDGSSLAGNLFVVGACLRLGDRGAVCDPGLSGLPAICRPWWRRPGSTWRLPSCLPLWPFMKWDRSILPPSR